MKAFQTVVICTTFLAITFVAGWCFDALLSSDRELVIRHVIDLTPNLKRK